MAILIERDVMCKLRDGTLLRADVYRPSEEGRYPVLLLRTPYSKGLWQFTHLTLDPARAAEAGYVVVIQDVRGRWTSGGDAFDPYRDEFDDGYDTVEWAAGLPYADGTVGVYGVSYMGGTAWQAAAAAPPALRAIAPTTAPNDQFIDLGWRGGAFLWGTHVLWYLQAVGPSAMIRSKLGAADFVPSFIRLVDDTDAFDTWVRHLPPRGFPPARPDAPFAPAFFEAMRHPTRGDYHRARSVYERHDQIRVPALIIAGWHDLLLGADLAHYTQMKTTAATGEARERTRLIVGPWSHGMFLNVVGDLDFGVRSSGLFLDLKEDLTALNLRWFGRRLKGVPTGIDEEPPVKLFVQGINRWRSEEAWPLARAVPTPWYLGAAARLGPEPPRRDEPPDVYVYDPQDPCPTRGGTLLMPRTYPAGPLEQRGRRDVLVYSSEPLGRAAHAPHLSGGAARAEPRAGPARRPRLQLRAARPRPRGDRAREGGPPRRDQRLRHRLGGEAVRRVPRRPHLQRVRRHPARPLPRVVGRAHARDPGRGRALRHRLLGHVVGLPRRPPDPAHRDLERLSALRPQPEHGRARRGGDDHDAGAPAGVPRRRARLARAPSHRPVSVGTRGARRGARALTPGWSPRTVHAWPGPPSRTRWSGRRRGRPAAGGEP